MEKKTKSGKWFLIGSLVLLLLTIFSNIQSAVNQSQALMMTRRIVSVENTFKGSHGKYGSLPELWKEGLLPVNLSDSSYRGFHYVVKVEGQSFKVKAEPLIYSINGYWGTGRFMICLNQDGSPCDEPNK